jgi:hypothetical protein
MAQAKRKSIAVLGTASPCGPPRSFGPEEGGSAFLRKVTNLQVHVTSVPHNNNADTFSTVRTSDLKGTQTKGCRELKRMQTAGKQTRNVSCRRSEERHCKANAACSSSLQPLSAADALIMFPCSRTARPEASGPSAAKNTSLKMAVFGL